MSRLLNYCRWRFGILKRMLDRNDRKLHEESVKFRDLMAANNQNVFDRMYSDPKLLRHYLVDERLDFYSQVAKRVESYYTNDKASASCVDVGCGTGHLLVEMRKRGFLGRLAGLDSAGAAAQQVHSHDIGLEFRHGYLSDQAWHGEFDIVLCTEVLEHCDHPAEIVKDMLVAVKPGGMIVITVPDGRKDTWEGHIHFWSPESFKLFIDSFQKKADFEYFDNTNFCALYR